MPYVCLQDNRYIGEHNCKKYHYGDQTMLRECCMADCLSQARNAKRVAMTEHHPAYRMFLAAWNELTDAEMISVQATLKTEGITTIAGYLV